MITLRSANWVFLLASAAAPSFASELSYTFIDFQAISNTVEAAGTQSPVPAQTVAVLADEGDGISIAGSVLIGTRFFVAGEYLTSIVDVSGVITNPLGTTAVTDNFDLIQTRIAFGYQKELSENFDIVFELSYDSSEYDFGSFAGENFDMGRDGRRRERRVPLESAQAVRALRSRACQSRRQR